MTPVNRLFIGAYIGCIWLKRVTRSFVGSFYNKLIGTPYQPLVVYKVIKYSIEAETESDVTNLFLGGEVITVVEDETLEFRFMWLGRTYRFVSAKPNAYPSVSHCMKVPQLDQLIVKAVLINVNEGLFEDVLERVNKFNGPCYDRFGETIQVNQMFAHDDLDAMSKLMVITRTGDIFAFEPTDVFNLKKYLIQ